MIGVDMGDGTILVVRDRLLTGSEPPLTTYELAIGRLTAQLAEANQKKETSATNARYYAEKCCQLETQLAERDTEIAKTYNEAAYLAKSLHKRSYSDVTTWGLCDSAAGIITQIDNMVAGLYEQITVSQQENSALRAEVERLSSAIGLQEYTKHIRKQAAQEIYNSLQKCFWAVDFETVRANLKHKFGLEG